MRPFCSLSDRVFIGALFFFFCPCNSATSLFFSFFLSSSATVLVDAIGAAFKNGSAGVVKGAGVVGSTGVVEGASVVEGAVEVGGAGVVEVLGWLEV